MDSRAIAKTKNETAPALSGGAVPGSTAGVLEELCQSS
jgi:hypothetical protein